MRNTVCEKCEIIEYNLQNPIHEEIQKKIKKYDITVVPSIIVDEELKYTGILQPEEIKKIIEDS